MPPQTNPDDEVVFTRIRTRCVDGCCFLEWQPVLAPRKRVRALEGLVAALDRGRAAVRSGELDPTLN